MADLSAIYRNLGITLQFKNYGKVLYRVNILIF